MIRDFTKVKRDLVLAVDPSLYPAIEGSADSEAVAGKQGIKEPLQMTIGTSDGDRVWAFRHSSTRPPRRPASGQ